MITDVKMREMSGVDLQNRLIWTVTGTHHIRHGFSEEATRARVLRNGGIWVFDQALAEEQSLLTCLNLGSRAPKSDGMAP